MLIINDNDLCILPPALGDSSLHTLHVQGNKRIRRLPREMGKLHHWRMGGCVKEPLSIQVCKYPPPETMEQEQGLNLACDLMRRVWESEESGRLALVAPGLATVPPYICEAPLVTCLTELNIFQTRSPAPPAMGLDEARAAAPG